MRILFMGTPDVAEVSLRRLYADGHEICAVFTQPDRPKNRGMKLQAPPVKELALEHGTPVYQLVKLRDGEAERLIRELAPELIVVVAYGRLIPNEILAIPPLGCINIHGSLLPKYRGSAPIQWTVLNGDETAGVTAMYLAEEMDAGDMIAVRETPVGEYETSGELFDRLKELGAELLSDTVRAIADGTAGRAVQDHSAATYARPLSKADSPIDWNRSAAEILNQIRGLNPWPSATANISGRDFKIHAAVKDSRKTEAPAGTLLSATAEGLEMACGDGNTLRITILQEAGGRRMAVGDYLLGHKL